MTQESRDPCRCPRTAPAAPAHHGIISGRLFITLMCIPPVLVLITFVILYIYHLTSIATR